ncbi:YrrS family protein [Alteribacter natronophilus]|uniref:YrrS family protein n=1 Tax=Alteribacter natronophilus TaxID=2583810 RepID=UPI00110F0394|nr:YrrS family protein [Alteribacter natronophilus]TMW73939.1 DUF1510 family protein [Alteribacter natronophilus]
MAQYGTYGSPNRAEMRKKQRINRFLNIAIVLVVVSIFAVGGMTLFGGGGTTPTAGDEEQEENNTAEEQANEEAPEEDETEDDFGSDFDTGTNEEDADESEDSNGTEDEGASSEETAADDSSEETNGTEEDDTSDENGSGSSAPEDGEWEPIGTEQNFSEGEFHADYTRDSTNWNEMREAFAYAIDVNESDMIMWRVENGGDAQSAVGTVGLDEHSDNPFRVRIEWVDNEGWQPVSVEQLDHNPY